MNRRRLDPFLLPSDTDFRFVLLVVVVLGVTLYIYNVLFFSLAGGGMGGLNVYGQCDRLAVATAARVSAREAGRGVPDPLRAVAIKGIALEECIVPVRGATATWMMGGVLGLLGLGGFLYWTWPERKLRRDGLVPLTAEDAPEVVVALEDLSRVAGLRVRPRFVWDPLCATSSGLAFGRWGRRYVALTGGLVTQWYTDLPAFRAVVLHELAHLRNGDVDKTYAALAAWQAFVVVGLVPYFLSLVGQPLDWVADVTWRIVVLAEIVYLTRNALLRTRELYADARASLWDGPAGALGRVLSGLPAPPVGAAWSAPGRRRWLSVHPDPRERYRTLDDTEGLFRIGFWDALGTGIAATIAVPHVVAMLAILGLGGYAGGEGQVVAALVFAPLAAGVLVLAAWRAVLEWRLAAGQGRERGGGRHALWGVGLGLGGGFLLGRVLSFDAVVGLGGDAPASAASALAAMLLGAVLAIAVLVGTLALLWWVVLGARSWIAGRGVADRELRLAFCLSLGAASVLLATWLGALSAAGETAAFLFPRPSWAGIVAAVGWALARSAWLAASQPLTVLAIAALAGVPVAARVWNRRTGSPEVSAGTLSR